MDVLDLEVAQPAFLLRHEIRQRKRRDRAGEGHLDLAGIRGGCVEDDERRGDAKADAKTDAKTSTECAQSNVRHDNSPPGRKRHRRRKNEPFAHVMQIVSRASNAALRAESPRPKAATIGAFRNSRQSSHAIAPRGATACGACKAFFPVRYRSRPPPFRNDAGQADQKLSLGRAYRP